MYSNHDKSIGYSLVCNITGLCEQVIFVNDNDEYAYDGNDIMSKKVK